MIKNVFKNSITELYHTFQAYKKPLQVEGCPCCVSESDQAALHRKPLRKLQAGDLDQYAFKALSTWGSVADFKHYLPRIFKLMTGDDFLTDTFVVVGKLAYAHWETWPDDEQGSIRNFLESWWFELAQHNSSRFQSDALDLLPFISPLPTLLKQWKLSKDDLSLSNLAYLINYHYWEIAQQEGAFVHLTAQEGQDVVQWLRQQAEVLAEGFLHFEAIDPDIARELSDAYDLLDLLPLV